MVMVLRVPLSTSHLCAVRGVVQLPYRVIKYRKAPPKPTKRRFRGGTRTV